LQVDGLSFVIGQRQFPLTSACHRSPASSLFSHRIARTVSRAGVLGTAD
jgi:hypothetical protein